VVGKWSRDQLLEFWNPSISRERFELDTSNWASIFLPKPFFRCGEGPKIPTVGQVIHSPTSYDLTFSFFFWLVHPVTNLHAKF